IKMLSPLSQEEAHHTLQPFYPKLLECVSGAFRDFRSFQVEKHPDMFVRARRTLLQDLVVRDVHRTYSEAPGFRVVDPKTGRYLLAVADRILLQVKHLTQEFRTAFSDTQTNQKFNAQEELDGLPPLPRVTLGYRLDALEAAIEGVYVLYSIDNEPVWWYRIPEEGEGQDGAETLPLFPPAPVGPVAPAATPRRVTPKKQPDEEGTKVIPLFGGGQD
ncbi:MAG TPA: hypothetical protein VFQ76_08760, partial [Longimicrobiaceae bacterium]|nr:hypothetical protein [Longimicrobiaceae bacterium]